MPPPPGAHCAAATARPLPTHTAAPPPPASAHTLRIPILTPLPPPLRSTGDCFQRASSAGDFRFFLDTEVFGSAALKGVFGFTTFCMLLFLATYWDSREASGTTGGSEPLLMVGMQIIAFFCVQPYYLALPDWRNFMMEEADALLHSSASMNKNLKTGLIFGMILAVTALTYGVMQACIGTLSGGGIFLAMLMDNVSSALGFILLGNYSGLPMAVVQVIAGLPFLLMIFLSTTFSPGAGVEGVKALRFLFTRFYLFCMLPGASVPDLDGCPSGGALTALTVLSGCLGLILFVAAKLAKLVTGSKQATGDETQENLLKDPEHAKLYELMFGAAPGASRRRSGDTHARELMHIETATREIEGPCLGTLTVVVGASGSGKTTFLNDVHKMHKCTYIRQYHNLRPYILVSKIPNFDASKLPYWDLYTNVPDIRIGGTMAGEFTAGLSGGQRKLLLFELIRQRTADSKGLLIVLDEPFAGVTDDFVPWITEQLRQMRQKHNLLLVTNDHVKVLRAMADNLITVSATDRTAVDVNGKTVGRDLGLLAVASGEEFKSASNSSDVAFFFNSEVYSSGQLKAIFGFTFFCMALFLACFWNSKKGSEPLVLMGIQIISYFCVNPYLASLVDWRIYMLEEADALMHSSASANKAMKTSLTLTLILVVSLFAYGIVQCVIDTLSGFKFLIGMVFDTLSLILPLICLGLYSPLSFQAVQVLGSFPFLMMLFMSTTQSPGAGVEGVKGLRFLFVRFYLWCVRCAPPAPIPSPISHLRVADVCHDHASNGSAARLCDAA